MSIRSIAAVVAVAAALAAPSAFATSGFTSDNSEVGGKSHPMPSSKSRAQVKQDRAVARSDGAAPRMDGALSESPRPTARTRTSNSREKVKSEVKQAQAAGTLRQLNRE